MKTVQELKPAHGSRDFFENVIKAKKNNNFLRRLYIKKWISNELPVTLKGPFPAGRQLRDGGSGALKF